MHGNPKYCIDTFPLIFNAETERRRGTNRYSSFSKIVRAFLIFAYLLVTSSLSASITPWGKDADIAIKSYNMVTPPKSCKTPIVGAIGEAVINFHQTQITQCDGPRSNFRPSSSQYMLDAMRKYGFFNGFSMGCDRLMRENGDPWVYRTTLNEHQELMKYDPVP